MKLLFSSSWFMYTGSIPCLLGVCALSGGGNWLTLVLVQMAAKTKALGHKSKGLTFDSRELLNCFYIIRVLFVFSAVGT